MSKDTKIDWLAEFPDGGHTASGWWGCTPQGPECAHCYAAALAMRDHHIAYLPGGERRQIDDFAGTAVRLNNSARRRGQRPLVFWSLSDPFDAEVPVRWLCDAVSVLTVTDHLRWVWLTKRPQNVILRFAAVFRNLRATPVEISQLHNLSLGVSAGNQKTLNERLPHLLGLPVSLRAWRVLSLEPLLEPVDLPRRWDQAKPDWVIIGGESGPGARDCQSWWIEDLVQQCRKQAIPVFVKQLGTQFARRNQLRHPKAADPNEWPTQLRVREFPSNRKL